MTGVWQGFAFPRVSTLSNPLGSSGRLNVPVEPTKRREVACGGKNLLARAQIDKVRAKVCLFYQEPAKAVVKFK
jgi:hypothetical protein